MLKFALPASTSWTQRGQQSSRSASSSCVSSSSVRISATLRPKSSRRLGVDAGGTRRDGITAAWG